MNLLNSSLKITTARLATTIASFGGLVFFAQELGASRLGIFFLFKALYDILYFLTDMGLSGAIIKRVSERNEPGQILSVGILIKLPPIIIAIAIVLLLREAINDYIGAALAPFLAVGIFLTAYGELSIKILQAELQIGWFATLQFLKTVVFVGSGILLIMAGLGVHGLIYSVLLSEIIIIVIGTTLRTTPLRRPSLNHAFSLFAFAKYRLPTKFLTRAMSWADVLVIGVFLSQAHVGAYEVAWRASKPAVLLATAVSNIIFPTTSGLDQIEDQDRIKSMLADGLALAILLPIPAFFGALLFSHEILNFIFGETFGMAWLVLIVLMGGRIFYAIFLILDGILEGMNQIRLVARAAFVTGIFNIIGNIVFVPQFGIVGAAFATSLTFALYAVLLALEISQFGILSIDYQLVGFYVIASVTMAILLIGVQIHITIDNLYLLIAVVLVGVITYISILLINPYLRKRILSYR